MDSPEPNSPQSRNGSTYGTPTESATIAKPGSDKDPQLVVGAGRSLKNMLVDLMSVLENQAKSRVFIQGDITLRVEGREAYTIKLFNEDNVEPTNLKVRIGNAPSPTVGEGKANTAQKRRPEPLDLTTDNIESIAKRARTENAAAKDTSEEDVEAGQDEATVMTKLNNISAQIKWVEECRRIAGELHDSREEKWRSTSATFHDDNRKAREGHEAWMIAEMGWQRTMLIQLATDMKGLYPLGHSLKWETPPHLQAPPHQGPTSLAPIPMPSLPPGRKPYTPRTQQKKMPPTSAEAPNT